MFDNLASILASNTINLTNIFELMEDQNYTVDLTFSVFKFENVMQKFASFGKFNIKQNCFV